MVDPQRTLYPRSGHLSTINQASEKVRQPETDVLNTEPRRLDHIKQHLLFIYHAVAEQKLPVVGDSEYIVIAQNKVGCLQQMAMLTTSIYIEPLNIVNINWPLMCRGVCRGRVMRVSEHSSTASNTP